MIGTFRRVVRALRVKRASFAAALLLGGFLGLTFLSTAHAVDAPASTKTTGQVVTSGKIVRSGDDGGAAPSAGKPGAWGG